MPNIASVLNNIWTLVLHAASRLTRLRGLIRMQKLYSGNMESPTVCLPACPSHNRCHALLQPRTILKFKSKGLS